MRLIDACLKASVENPSFSNLRGRAFMAVLAHSYQLLLSAWDDLRAGRIAASSDHWRSLFEAPDYLLAVWLNEDFAREWANPSRSRTIGKTNPQAIVRKELNKLKPKRGDQRDARRKADLKRLQGFSHVSNMSAGHVFFRPPGAAGSFLAPEGYQADETMEAAAYVAYLSRDILGAAAASGGSILNEEWRTSAATAYEEIRDYLRSLRPEEPL